MERDQLDPNDTPPPGIQQITREGYMRHYKAMEKEAHAKRWNGEEDHTPEFFEEDLVKDLLLNEKGHKFSTLNSRRNALIHVYRERGLVNVLKMLYAPDYMDKLKAAGGAGTKKSREKGRMIPEEDFIKIHNQLGSGKQWSIAAQHMMSAGIASGARPIEWINAKWADKEKTILRLQTAKIKNINALNNIPPLFFGEEDIEEAPIGASAQEFMDKLNSLDIQPEEKEAIRVARFIENTTLFRDVRIEPEYQFLVDMHMDGVRFFLNTHDERYNFFDMPPELRAKYYRDVYYNNCRIEVRKACKKLFGDEKTYSPVDTRSTFAANRRALNGREKASDELGHTTLNSRVAAHYSIASKAWAKYRNDPNAAINNKVQAQLQKPGQTESTSPTY